jgi:nitrate reductase cytochrome c-type subunit
MALPTSPVTLTPEQLEQLNKKLSHMRHEINNHLSLIVAALELARYKPEMRERMVAAMSEQPPKITHAMEHFSIEFESTLGITRDA